MNCRLSSLLILCGMFLFTACKKENIDSTVQIPEDITPTTVLCNMELEINVDLPTLIPKTTGGKGPFTYLWSTGETRGIISISTEGDYELTVTDSEGCTATKSVSAFYGPCDSLMVTIIPSLNSDSTAWIITANAFDGTPPYSYAWSTGDSTQVIPFAYLVYVTVTDADDCTTIEANEIIDSPCRISVDRPNDTTLTAKIGDGIPPFSYIWSTGETTESINVFDDGVYSVTVTDRTSCISDASLEIWLSDPCIPFSVNIRESPRGSGQLYASTGGAPGPHSFEWSTGETTQRITVLADGEYSVTVTAGNNCVKEDTIDNVAKPECADLDFSFTSNTVVYTLKISPKGGTPPYFPLWSTGETSLQINVVSGETYTMKLTDSEGCWWTKSLTMP